MKLLKHEARLWAPCGGNVKTQDALGESFVSGLSDKGSTPLISTALKPSVCAGFRAFVMLCTHTHTHNEFQKCTHNSPLILLGARGQ